MPLPALPRRCLSVAVLAPFVATGLGAEDAAPQTLPTLESLGEAIGCVACADPSAFGAVMGVTVLPDGGVAVADRDPPLLRVFTAAGGLEAAFGRLGEGPGEIRRIGGVAATDRGTLVVTDFMGRHLTEFRRDGTLVGTHPVESTAMAVRADPTGAWLSWQIADWATFTGAVHLRASDASAGSIPLPSTDGRVVDDTGQAAAAGLFAAAPGPDGRVAVGQPMVYRVEVVAADGRPLHTVARDVPRTPRTAQELEELATAFLHGPAARGDQPEAAATPPDVDPLRPHFLAHGLAYDRHGRLWVRTARGGPTATVFDLFDAEGGFLGEVRLPVFLRHLAIGHGILAGVVADDVTGVERIARWRIVG